MSIRRNSRLTRWTAGLKWGVPLLATASGLLVSTSAQAASLQQVTGWSKNDVPTYISMYIYVPDKLATDPPIMVAAHYCGGNATAYYSFDSSVVALANQYGFIMIFPQTTNPASSADCWDVGSTKSLTHNGGGDTQAIVEMVDYTVTKYDANAARVYSMGSSSGAMLTEALMGVYPDVFKAGAEMSGVPDGCWSDGWSAGSNWGGTCASGNDMMSAAAWGNLVRAQYPGYTGPRPRLWLWVGTSDATISPNNFTQAILEWTNVLDLSSTPTSTMASNGDQQGSGQLWNNSCGQTVLEAWSLQGGGHAPTPTASTAAAIVSYFGLDKTGPDESASCGGMDAGTTAPDASAGKDASTVGMDATTGELDATSGGMDATTVGFDASTGEFDAGTTFGMDASIGVGTDASIGVGTDGSVSVATDASVGVGPDGSIVAIGDAGVGTPGSDGGTGDNEDGMGNAAGCGCRMVPADERFGGMLLAPIGAAIGILARRRRRSSK